MTGRPFYKLWNENNVISNNSFDINLINDKSIEAKDESSFVQIRPQQDPQDQLHYQHLALITSGKAEFLSHGQMAVLEILDWVENKVFFVGTKINDPSSKHLYVADTVQKGKTNSLKLPKNLYLIIVFTYFF